MTKKQKAKFVKYVMLAVAVFFLAVLVIPQLSVAATAPAWWIETHSFFGDLGSNFKENWMLYVFVSVLVVGVLKYKK